MITLNVLYPNKDGAKFDMDHYLTSHIPMLKRVLGSALKGCIVEQGLGGRDRGTKAEFAVLCHLRFDSAESYQQAIGPVAGQIRNDVANRESCDEVAAFALKQFPDLSVLVNNAGIYGPKGAIEEVDWDQWIEEYSRGHRHPVNRACHSIGIPLIVISLTVINIIVFVLEFTGQQVTVGVDPSTNQAIQIPKLILDLGFIPTQASVFTAIASMFLRDQASALLVNPNGCRIPIIEARDERPCTYRPNWGGATCQGFEL